MKIPSKLSFVALALGLGLAGAHAQNVPASSVTGSYRATAGMTSYVFAYVECANHALAATQAGCQAIGEILPIPWTAYFADGHGGVMSDGQEHSYVYQDMRFHWDLHYVYGTAPAPIGNEAISLTFAQLHDGHGVGSQWFTGACPNPAMDVGYGCACGPKVKAWPILAGSLPINFATSWTLDAASCAALGEGVPSGCQIDNSCGTQ